jgi:hypothetical protein
MSDQTRMQNSKSPSNRRSLVAFALLSATVIGAMGCGPQGYKRVASVEGNSAPGVYMVPPKVDILLAEDNSGSLFEMFNSVESQMPGFLADLESRGWDYHFVTIPLITQRPLQAGIASKQDGNWDALGLYVPPFPGAPANHPGNLAASFFRTPTEYVDEGHFISTSDIAYGQNGNEPAFATIDDAIYSRVNGTGFLRSDAMLAVLVVGNGNDSTGVNYCNRGDGYAVRCEDALDCTNTAYGRDYTSATSYVCRQRTWNSTQEYYRDRLIAKKGSAAKVKYYAAVANSNSSVTGNQCLGSNAFKGSRYQWMAGQLGGKSIDICTKSISTALSEMSQHLQATKLSFRTRYLFIGQEPVLNDPSKPVVITKHTAGGSVVIPQGGANGWVYRGLITAHAIDSPVEMNLTTGYAFELMGTARLLGDDHADVDYFPVGGEDSSG